MAEELAAGGMRIAPGASDCLSPVQKQVIPFVVVTTQALDESHRPPSLLLPSTRYRESSARRSTGGKYFMLKINTSFF